MIEPKNFNVKKDVSEANIIANGFTNKSEYYILYKKLYENTITLFIAINKSDYSVKITVRDQNTGSLYAPFYNPENRHNDLVYQQVCKKYNKLIDELVEKEIFEYEVKHKMNNDKTIKIKKLKDYAKIPARGSEYAAGYDLYACVDRQVKIKSGEVAKIGTGVAMELPVGYFGAIFARSGLATKQGLRPANAVGVCDCDYRGEYIVALYNDSAQTQVIHNGDKIAQLVLLPYEDINFVECEELSDTVRGSGGFGSTGKA